MCIMLRQNIAGAHNESGYRNNRKKLQDFFLKQIKQKAMSLGFLNY